MKGCLSLLMALLVVFLLAAAGYWAYQNYSGPGAQSGHVISVSQGPSLTLTNGTQWVLTVMMKKGTSLVRFEIAPGHNQTQSIETGTYDVDGKISDPSTDPFHSQWTFQNGGNYKANFVRDGNAIAAVAVLEAAGSGSSASNPPDKRKPNPPDANKKP